MVKHLDASKYTIFFLMLLGYTCSASFWIDNLKITWFLQGAILIVLFLFTRSLPFQKIIKKIFIGLLILAFGLKSIQVMMTLSQVDYILNGVMLIVFLMLIGHILKDIFIHKNDITFEMLMGAICVYALIGVTFGVLYGQICQHVPEAFDFGTLQNQLHYEKQFNLYYYSFTTLTTVGFGDIVPKHLAVKGITIIEQMTGVLYLAVLVSKLVASFHSKA